MKIETIASDEVRNIRVYPWGRPLSGDQSYSEVRISKADFESNPELCWQIWVNALRSLKAGFYTVAVEATPHPFVQDVRVGKRGGVRVRPYDGKTINIKEQVPCLSIKVEQPFRRVVVR